MLKLKKVAVTGAPASGKSSVCRLFEGLGAYVVSADAIVHQLLSPETSIGRQVIELFGSEILTENEIDRKKIATIVFNNKEALNRLEKLLHPAVISQMEKEYEQAIKKRAPLFVAEVPLLFESGQEKAFDVVITVVSSRAKERYKGTHFDERNKRLVSDEERKQKAHYIIDNSGDEKATKDQVNQLYHLLMKDAP